MDYTLTRYGTTWIGSLKDLSYHLALHGSFTRAMRDAGYSSKAIDSTIRHLRQGRISEEDLVVINLMGFELEEAE